MSPRCPLPCFGIPFSILGSCFCPHPMGYRSHAVHWSADGGIVPGVEDNHAVIGPCSVPAVMGMPSGGAVLRPAWTSLVGVSISLQPSGFSCDRRSSLPRLRPRLGASMMMKQVDLGEPTSFLDHVYLGCAQRECTPNEFIIDLLFCSNHEFPLEQLKITRVGKTSRKDGRVVLRHGRTCSKMR